MDKLMNPQEVAEMLGIRLQTVYVWSMRRRIPSIKVGSALRFRADQILEFIEENTRSTMEAE